MAAGSEEGRNLALGSVAVGLERMRDFPEMTDRRWHGIERRVDGGDAAVSRMEQTQLSRGWPGQTGRAQGTETEQCVGGTHQMVCIHTHTHTHTLFISHFKCPRGPLAHQKIYIYF